MKITAQPESWVSEGSLFVLYGLFLGLFGLFLGTTAIILVLITMTIVDVAG